MYTYTWMRGCRRNQLSTQMDALYGDNRLFLFALYKRQCQYDFLLYHVMSSTRPRQPGLLLKMKGRKA